MCLFNTVKIDARYFNDFQVCKSNQKNPSVPCFKFHSTIFFWLFNNIDRLQYRITSSWIYIESPPLPPGASL